MASTAPLPGPDTTIAPMYIVPCGLLGLLALGLCMARMYTRRRSGVNFYPDDYLNVVTVVCWFSAGPIKRIAENQ